MNDGNYADFVNYANYANGAKGATSANARVVYVFQVIRGARNFLGPERSGRAKFSKSANFVNCANYVNCASFANLCEQGEVARGLRNSRSSLRWQLFRPPAFVPREVPFICELREQCEMRESTRCFCASLSLRSLQI